MKLLPSLLTVVCALAVRGNAFAALTIALSPTPQVAGQGAELFFSGTLTNTSGTDKLFLNDLQATLIGPSSTYLALKPNAFFAHVPGVLLPGESYTGILFGIGINPLAPTDAYAGTIDVRGGADIFAGASLATAGFMVGSPVVGIVATDPNASEFGPETGTVTVARTGSTGAALSVPVTASGTAVNGTTYQPIPASVTIPAGLSSASVAIVPLPDNLPQGDRAAIFTLGASVDYQPGANVAATVTIRDKPIDDWRFDEFGAAANDPAAGVLADWESDGARNIIEYGLSLAPLLPDAGGLPAPELDGDYLTLSFVPRSWAVDLVYTVEGSTDLVNWSAADVEFVPVGHPAIPGRLTFRHKNPLSLTSAAYLRLSITRISPGP